MRIGLSAILAAVLVLPAPRPAWGAPGGPPFEPLVRLLHEGRFDEAEERARQALRADPSPGASFFHAFVLYWRLLYDGENPALQESFERRLRHAAETAETRLRARPADASAALWAGMSHLLLAQLFAAEKKAMAAASEAKKARRHLDTAVRLDPQQADALFGLGTYNYLLGQLPAGAGGLRALMGLPAGDREAGLDQLERAARKSVHFDVEARMLLVGLYSGRRERRMAESLRQSERLLSMSPQTIAALHGAARTALAVGDATRAARLLDQALSRAESPGADPAVLASLRLHRARSEFVRFRPDLALTWLEPLLREPGGVPVTLREDVRNLAAQAASVAEAPGWYSAAGARAVPAATWRKALPALQLERKAGAKAAAEELCRLATHDPQDPVLALLAGRGLVIAGQGDAARELLARAEGSGRLPDVWLGPSRLLAGHAEDLTGDRSRAVAWYRKALDAPPFIAKDAPYLFLELPYRKGGLHSRAAPRRAPSSTRVT